MSAVGVFEMWAAHSISALVNSIPQMNAYWISCDKEEPWLIGVDNRHINKICEHPEWFGLTDDYVKEVFKKYNEPLGHEGKARDEIMADLISKGWIRIRYNPKQYSWTFQVKDVEEPIKNNILQFLWLLKRKTNQFINCGVRVINLKQEVILFNDQDTLNEIVQRTIHLNIDIGVKK